MPLKRVYFPGGAERAPDEDIRSFFDAHAVRGNSFESLVPGESHDISPTPFSDYHKLHVQSQDHATLYILPRVVLRVDNFVASPRVEQIIGATPKQIFDISADETPFFSAEEPAGTVWNLVVHTALLDTYGIAYPGRQNP